MTLEDETGFANLVVFPAKFEKYRKAILNSRLMLAEGTVQIEGEVVHLIVAGCHDFLQLLNHLTDGSLEEKSLQALSTRDEKEKPVPKAKGSQNEQGVEGMLFAEARNFR